MLQEALDPVLPRPLIEIVGDYSCASRSRQFAEELYAELWKGKTRLLHTELFDVKKGVLKEPHHFWEYLAGGAERVVVFVRMLSDDSKATSKAEGRTEEACTFGW